MSWLGEVASFPHLLGAILPAFYEPFHRFINKTMGYLPTGRIPWTSLIAGASSSAIGGGSPSLGREQLPTSLRSVTGKSHVLNQGSDAGTYPVAVSLGGCSNHPQAYSPALPVGIQRYYQNSREALARIFKAEGSRGIFRGIDAATLRTSMGSSVQVPGYHWTKTARVAWHPAR